MTYASPDTDYTSLKADGPRSSIATRTPDLLRVIERVEKIRQGLQDITMRLNGHADRLHGERPEECAKELPHPVRSGVLGSLEDEIDRLEDALSSAQIAADRNCKLA